MITDARVLKDEFIPGEVVHRDTETEQIARALEPLLDEGVPEDVLLHGPSGAGKTCISRYTLEQLEQEHLDLRYTYINCWENYNRFRVLYKALEGIGKTLDVHRQSTPKDELLTRLRDNDDRPYVLVLDEADQLEDQSVLYDLYSMDHVTMIMIANAAEDVFARMEDRIRSRLMSSRRIRFEHYPHDALVSILEDRAEWGLHPDAWDDTVLDAIANAAAGDARIAIGTLRVAARTAEENGMDRITPELVEQAAPDAREETRQAHAEKLNPHQETLYEIVQEHDEIKPRALYDAYREQVDEPKSERTLRNYLQKMEHYNLVEARGEKRGRTYTAV